MERLVPHVLQEMLALIDKNLLLTGLKESCSESRFAETRADLFSFPPSFSSSMFGEKILWTRLINEMDLLERLSNLLGPGHFNCFKRTKVLPVMNPEDEQRTIIVIWVKFLSEKLVSDAPPLSCTCGASWKHKIVDGLCTYCGSYLMLPWPSALNTLPRASAFSTPPRRHIQQVVPNAPARRRNSNE